MDDNIQVLLQTILDEASLAKITKQLSNEKIDLKVNLTIEDFAKNQALIKKQIETYSKEIQSFAKNSKINITDKESLKYAKDYYKQITKEQASAIKGQEKLAKAMADGREKAAVNSAINERKKLASAIETEIKSEEKLANTIGKKREQAELLRKEEEKRANIKQSAASNKALEDEYKLIQKIRNEIKNGKVNSQVDTVASQYNKMSQVTDVLKKDFSELKLAQETLVNSETPEALKSNYDKLATQLEKVKNGIKSINSKDLASGIDKSSAITKYQDYMVKNTNITKEAKKQLLEWIATIQSADDLTNGDLNNIKVGFNQLDSQMRSLNRLGLSFKDSVKAQASKFTQWVSISGIIMSGVNNIKNMAVSVKHLDDAMVDLTKTTDATAYQLKEFYNSANATAKQLGVSTQEIIEQTSAWSRLGNSIKDAKIMAEDSSIFKSISPGMDIDTATNGLVSSMKAFGIEADDVLDGIISKINIIGNTQAVDNQDIVDILTRSSSAMAEANNTLEQTIALGTAGTEITRDASGMGQVLKTTSMRIRGYDEEVEEYTDDLANLSGQIADLTKTASTPGGISIFSDADKQTYKSTYEIFKEIAQIQDQLTDKQSADLLEALAGKRNGQAVSAILSNFKAAEKSMSSMANSSGNAMEEMEVIYDSLDYKLNRLSETGTKIGQNLFQRDQMKATIDALTLIVELIEKITSGLGLFGTAGTIGAGILGLKKLGLTNVIVYKPLFIRLYNNAI